MRSLWCCHVCRDTISVSSECHQADRNPGMKLQSDLQEVLQASCCTCSRPTAGCKQGSQLMASVTSDWGPILLKRRQPWSLLQWMMLRESCGQCYWERTAGWKRYIAPFHTFLWQQSYCFWTPVSWTPVSRMQRSVTPAVTETAGTFPHLQMLKCLSQLPFPQIWCDNERHEGSSTSPWEWITSEGFITTGCCTVWKQSQSCFELISQGRINKDRYKWRLLKLLTAFFTPNREEKYFLYLPKSFFSINEVELR